MSAAADAWREEKQSAWLYRVVAECERGTPREALFIELAESAEKQAAIWMQTLREAGDPLPAPFRPSARTRLVARLTRWFKPRAMRGVLAAMKVRGMALYSTPAHPMPVRREDVGRSHRSAVSGNALRAGVFGVNDGLVSNAALIFGVAGATQSTETVLLTGAAGLLAGAFSMAAGEYVSVRAQREMYRYQIGLERDELMRYPEEEAAELALIYAAKGVPVDEARRIATRLIADPERALDTLAREELGLNPDELASPWVAALASFATFTVGAAVPLLPFVLAESEQALVGAGILTACALFAVGASMSLFTGRSAGLSGARMLMIGSAAGLATYFIGTWLGVALV